MEGTRVDVLIVTALKDELDAVLAWSPTGENTGRWEPRSDPYGFAYHVRELRNADGELLRVAAAYSGEMGESGAATRAVTLIDELDPTCLAMCGICAGSREKTFLGDVIVAEHVFSYDHGKLITGKGRSTELFRDIKTYNLDEAWAMKARFFADEFQRTWTGAKDRPPSRESQRSWLLHALDAHTQENGASPDKHPERKTRCPDWKQCLAELREAGLIAKSPGRLELTEEGHLWLKEDRLQNPDGQMVDPPFRVHVGPIATGKTVREDPELFERLKHFSRRTLGVEMEAAAIGAVASKLQRRSIIVKAVSDHADHDKDDAYRAFACRASGEFLLGFLRKEMHPAEQREGRSARQGTTREVLELDGRETASQRFEFLDRVKKICGFRWTHPGTSIQTRQAPPPFGSFLEVVTVQDKLPTLFRVAAVDQDISEELLESFDKLILTEHRRLSPGAPAYLIHIGRSASATLDRKAASKQINLYTFEEFQGLIDFSGYIEQQTARLRDDVIYLPEHYVDQRARLLVDGLQPERTNDVLSKIRELLDTPDARFLLVLGDFGTGKTFLLHELARRMGQEGSALVPVLLEMRTLQKALDLRALVGQHFAVAPVRHFSVDRFYYMLREGRIVLLFDGFDELALRVDYERALEHFATICEAAQEKAKIVITSRTQHFLTDHDVKRELARRAETLPGHRIIKLERFGEEQVRQFLRKRLKDESAADERLKLLHDVKDLLGLSENPRLLSFIVELDPEQLEASRKGSGEITSANLYELLIRKWLEGEYARVNPPGAPRGLSQQQLRSASTALAMLLWEKTDRTVELNELPPELLAAVNARGPHSLDMGIVKHQLGSGSLLVRDDNGRFSFVHQSVMEWLVADAAAEELRTQGTTAILNRSEVSELMADFFIALAGLKAARAWVSTEMAPGRNDTAKKNALRIMGRLREQLLRQGSASGTPSTKNFEGSDLRGQDLSGADLREANLQDTDLSGATLVAADLSGARLNKSRLVRADLTKARLSGAKLTEANLSRANLMGADLRGATLAGARLRAARLVGAKVDSLEGCDMSGAALPGSAALEPTLSTRTASFAVAFSPTDELLATGHLDGSVFLWDTGTDMAVRRLRGHAAPVLGVAFNPKGTILATASSDAAIALWRVDSGQRLRLLEGHKGYVLGIAFSPDGTLLASASDDRTIALWRVDNGRRLWVLEGHTDFVRSVAFSPDGATLASASDDQTVAIWSVETGQRLRVLKGHEGFVYGVAFSPDGATLASASDDQTVALWSVKQGERLHVFEGHEALVRAVAFSPDGATLASASDDQTVALWSVNSRKRLDQLEGHAGNIRSIAFKPDGAILASVSDDRTIALWDTARRERLRSMRGHSVSLHGVAWSPVGGVLAAISDDETVTLWNVGQGQPLRQIQGPTDHFIHRVVFSPDGGTLACASEDSTISLWNVSEGRFLRRLQGHKGAVHDLAFSPSGALLASASEDSTIRLWNAFLDKRPRLLKGHSAVVKSVAFDPKGQTLASASSDRSIVLWNIKDRKIQNALMGHADTVNSIAFSPDGATLASASSDQTVALWSVVHGKRLHLLMGHQGAVRSVAISPGGNLLASASNDRTVILWNVARGEPVFIMEGHSAPVRGVDFSPDGRTLVSASTDGTMRLWDVVTGACTATLLKLSEGWVAFRPDGHYRSGGNTEGAFWHASGLCRFEPGELDPYLSLRIPETEPLLP